MRKIIVILFIFSISCTSVKASNYIIMTDDNRILESGNSDEVRSIASISKIMTAIIALEYGDFSDVWYVGDEVNSASGKLIYLKEDQLVSMATLLYGLLLESGNDASLVIAKRVAGSVDNFVKLMNEKAKEIGMLKTEFNNPNGMDVTEKGNYSNCYDLAILMNYALKNEMFAEIVKTKKHKSDWGATFNNSNKLLNTFPLCIGGKTGFTNKAGSSLMTASKSEDLTLTIVTLNMPERYEFQVAKYEEYFNKYQKITLLEKQEFIMDGYNIIINEPFKIVGNDEELQQAEMVAKLDKENNEYIVQYKFEDYIVNKVYEALPVKNRCLFGICI